MKMTSWMRKVCTALFGVVTLLVSVTAQANTIEQFRVWTSPSETRIVMDTQAVPEYSYFSLTSPDRLVIDVKKSTNQASLPVEVKDSPVLSKIRKSTPAESSSYRLVFELKSKVTPNLFTLAPTPDGQKGHRLVIDLPHNAAKSVASPSTSSSSTTTAQVTSAPIARAKDVLIVIDPGHGGEDPGSIGPTKKYEKNATLAISRKLEQRLNAVDGVKARLTRNGDYFVNLNRRVALARENNAHLLISIHADAFTSPQPRGGSVFVLNTRRANTEISRWIENSERQSELLGGSATVINNDDKNVNQTLLDLKFSYSQKEGYKLAEEILKEMGKVAKLHKTKPVNTSLAVLRSPQIPSVLVETGFISNPTEEKLLFQRSHQDKLAKALADAVITYLKQNPPEGVSPIQSAAPTYHTVKSGESLSVIASRYGTSTSALQRENNLKSSTIKVGQKLTIPSGSTSSQNSVKPVETETLTHVVKSGEYLGSIAQKYKVSVAAIKRENNLRSDTVRVGQKLKVTVKLVDKPVRYHTVARGEYLGKIASKYGVTISAVRSANNLRSDELAIGQKLVIPNK
ncbi:N-acetylmuramoyl-L-alanine amidase [Vibrio sp. qd031]|nr:N-acetylmuramoyl-L-alanine amidase [Vibrio sp. qd031]